MSSCVTVSIRVRPGTSGAAFELVNVMEQRRGVCCRPFTYGGLGTRLAEALLSAIEPSNLSAAEGASNATSGDQTMANNRETFRNCIAAALSEHGLQTQTVARVTTAASDQVLAVRLALQVSSRVQPDSHRTARLSTQNQGCGVDGFWNGSDSGSDSDPRRRLRLRLRDRLRPGQYHE